MNDFFYLGEFDYKALQTFEEIIAASRKEPISLLNEFRELFNISVICFRKPLLHIQ